MHYHIKLIKETPVLNTRKQNYCDTLPPGEYNLIQVGNPFNKPDCEPLKPWLAILGNEHIGLILLSWEQFGQVQAGLLE